MRNPGAINNLVGNIRDRTAMEFKTVEEKEKTFLTDCMNMLNVSLERMSQEWEVYVDTNNLLLNIVVTTWRCIMPCSSPMSVISC